MCCCNMCKKSCIFSTISLMLVCILIFVFIIVINNPAEQEKDILVATAVSRR